MKKNSGILVILFITLLIFSGKVYASSDFQINEDNKDQGIIDVIVPHIKGKMKIMVQKGNDKYYYNIDGNKETIPLQLGNGEYTIQLLENVLNNKYKVVGKRKLDVKLDTTTVVYLQSMKLINWEGTSAANIARELTIDKTNEEEKVLAIYKYVVENFTYDLDKPKYIKNDYVPNLDEIVKSNMGICYDYAALFCGMTRSVGIPTKLVMGYKDDIKSYHAWNEVYLDRKWIIIDTTYDSCKGSKENMKKSKDSYRRDREY